MSNCNPLFSVNPWKFAFCWCFFLMPVHAQHQGPDFVRAHITVTPDPFTRTISGDVRYEFTTAERMDSIYLDAQRMRFDRVELDGAKIGYRSADGKLLIGGPITIGRHELLVSYKATPRQAIYFFGWQDEIEGNEQIWTQGQGKDSSHWVPVVDRMDEKVVFDLSILFDSTYQVIANGTMVNESTGSSLKRWDFEMDNPMSSYLLAFAVGRYDHLAEASGSGITMKLYYPENQDDKARWTYLHSKDIFDFIEADIGIPYPWGDYKQVPVTDFLYAGMENTGATFFSDRYLVDSLGFQDENYININAHELAHQWFGNLVTEQDASHHWLHEGFATYYAYRAEAHLMGEEEVHWKLFDTAMALSQMDAEGRGEALVDPTSSSLTFYEKGAWALILLREQVGDRLFSKGVKEFLEAHAYSNVTVQDFLGKMEQVSGQSLSGFRRNWLEAKTFPKEAALKFLSGRSPSIKQFIGLPQLASNRQADDEKIQQAWQAHGESAYREHLIRDYRELFTRPFLDTLFLEGSVPVSKALLVATQTIEPWMIPRVEAWLDAPSYDLREAALFRLWVVNPPERRKYLDRISENGSLADIGLQQLWWLLSVLTEPGAGPETKMAYLRGLRETTGPSYSWEIRQNAFSMLHEVGALDRQNILDLMQSTEHHSWQFRKFARNLFEMVLQDNGGPDILWEIARTLSRQDYPYVYEKLEQS